MFESANEKFKIGPLNNSPYPLLGDDQNKITNAYIEDFKTVGFGRKDSQKYPWYNNPFDPRMSFQGFQQCVFKQQDEKDNEQTKARLTENVFLALDNPSAVMNDYLYGYREYIKNLSGLPTIHIGSGDDPGDIVHDDGSQECKRLFQRIRSQSVRSVFPMESEARENPAIGKALTETNCQLLENHSPPDRMDQLCLNLSPDLSKYHTGNADESLLQKSLEKLCDGIGEEAKENDQILIPTTRASVNKPQTPPGFSSKNLANNGVCFETAHVINETVTKDSALKEKTFNQYFLTKDKHVTDDSSHLQKERKAAEKIHHSSSSMSRNIQEAVAKLIPEEVPDTKLPSGQPDKHLPSGQPDKNLPCGQPDTEIPSGQPDKNLPSGQPHEKLPSEQPDKNLPSGQPDKNLPSGQPDKNSPIGHPDKNLPRGQTQVQQPAEEEQSKDKKITHLSDISGGTTPVSKGSSNSSWAEKLFYKDVNGKEKCSKEGKSSLENNKVSVAEKASKTIKSNLRPNSEPFIPPSLASKSNNALQVQNTTLFPHEDFQPRHYTQNLVPHAQNNYLTNIQPAPYPQQLPSQSLYFPTNVPPPPVHGLAPVIAQQNYRNPQEAFQNANWFNDNGIVAPPDYNRYQFQPPLQSPLIPSVVQNNQLFNQNYPYNQGVLNYNTPDNLLPHDMATNLMPQYTFGRQNLMSSTFQQKNQPQHLYAFRESRNSFPYNFNNNNNTTNDNNNNNNNSLSDRSASCLETEERVIPRIEFRRSRSCEDLVLDGFKGRARPRAIRSNLIRIYPTNS